MTKVKDCIIFTNGMVASLDENGEQIADCQGFILDIAEKLKNCCDENTIWQFGEWNLKWYWEKKKLNLFDSMMSSFTKI